jgi:hypothetical protein
MYMISKTKKFLVWELLTQFRYNIVGFTQNVVVVTWKCENTMNCDCIAVGD